jgi:ABC-type multidrug transport system ATPase subunit
MIRTQELTKVYGDLRAINNLNIELVEGDLFGYIGPNGSGKTTTMRILGVRILDLHASQGNPPADRLHARLLRRV